MSVSGRLLGKYELGEAIGAGPCGVVFRARLSGAGALERALAVKQFHQTLLADAAVASRFAEAARGYARIEHPRVARLVEHAATYVAVELVDGVTLDRLLGGGRLPPGAALGIVARVGRALAYAHQKGVAHLGLCPTNVIATEDGEVKVCDFGFLPARLHLARGRLAIDAGLASRLAYLAPEQLAGEPGTVASDVFVLGALAVELCIGMPAFAAAAPAETMERVKRAEVAVAPGSMPVAALDVVRRALSREPAQRFANAEEMTDALDAALRASKPAGGRTDVANAVKKLLKSRAQTPTPVVPPKPALLLAAVEPARPLPASNVTLQGVAAPTAPRPPARPTPGLPGLPPLRGLPPRSVTPPEVRAARPPTAKTAPLPPVAPVAPVAPVVATPVTPAAVEPATRLVADSHDDELPPLPASEEPLDTWPGKWPRSPALVAPAAAVPAAPAAAGPPPVEVTPSPFEIPVEPTEPFTVRSFMLASLLPDEVAPTVTAAAKPKVMDRVRKPTERVPSPPPPSPGAAGPARPPTAPPPPAPVAVKRKTPPALRLPTPPAPYRPVDLSELSIPTRVTAEPTSGGVTTLPEVAAPRPWIKIAFVLVGLAAVATAYLAWQAWRPSDFEHREPKAVIPHTTDARSATVTPPDAAPVVPLPAAAPASAPAPDAAPNPAPVPAPAPNPPLPDAKLSITTTPPGATVYLDGADKGRTPLELPASGDRHRLVLVLAGYKLHKADVDGASGARIAIPLERVAPARAPAGLKVSCATHGRLYIIVDGQDTGKLCPNEQRVNVTVGAHTVELYDPISDATTSHPVDVVGTHFSTHLVVKD